MPDVLLVMHSQGNYKVLAQALAEHGYAAGGARTIEDLAHVLASSPLPDAALVDITGFDGEVWRMCEQLQRSQVPFVVISGASQRRLGVQGLEYGAASVLEKPLVKSSLLRLVAGLTKR